MILELDTTPFDTARSPLEFITVRNAALNSKVHIEVPLTEKDITLGGVRTESLLLLNRRRTLCGHVSAKYGITGTFNDDRLCLRCVAAMGDNSVRIFEREHYVNHRSSEQYTGENH